MINIDQYWSILIRTFLYQSHRLSFKTTIMPTPDQYWSILINIDQYWSGLFLPNSQTLFQNNIMPSPDPILDQSQIDQILILMDQVFLPKSQTLRFKTTIMPSPDQYWSILINNWCDIDSPHFSLPKSQTFLQNNYYKLWFKTTIMPSLDQYWSILINIDQYWLGLFLTKVTDSVLKQLLCRVLINIDQDFS